MNRLSPVRAGDVQGLGMLYDSRGGLIGGLGESFLQIASGWEMEVYSPWRRLLPKAVFMGFKGRAASRLYITTTRIVLIREIDSWRELSGEMTPLGIPTAVAKEARLKNLRSAGVRQFCEVYPRQLKLVSSRKFTKRGSMIDMRVLGSDDRQYAISFWKSDGKDDKTLSLIESQFKS
jgi:hypothetical protein